MAVAYSAWCALGGSAEALRVRMEYGATTTNTEVVVDFGLYLESSQCSAAQGPNAAYLINPEGVISLGSYQAAQFVNSNNCSNPSIMAGQLRAQRTYGAQSVALTAANTQAATAALGYVTQSYNDNWWWSITATITVPSLPYDNPPAPTNLAIAYNSDSQRTLTWSRPSTGASNPIHGIAVDRKYWRADGEHGWERVFTGDANSFVDTGGGANHAFQYRIFAYNFDGTTYKQSDYVTSGMIYTEPGQPGKPSVSRGSDGNITITWTNGPAQTAIVGTRIMSRLQGATGWQILTNITGTGTSYVWTGGALDEGYDFTVANRVNTGAVSNPANVYSTESPVASISPTVQPNPPAVTLNRQTVSASSDGSPYFATVTVTPNHPDGSAVSQVYIEVSLAGVVVATYDGTSLTRSVGQSGRASLGLTDPGVYQIRAYTKGLNPSASGWSTPVALTYAYSPTGAITSPTTSTYGKSRLKTTWSYNDQGGNAQLSALVKLYNFDSVVIEEKTISGQVYEATLNTILEDNTSYVLNVSVTSTVGLSTTIGAQILYADYAIPSPAAMTPSFDPATGAVGLTGYQPAPASGYEVDYVVCERKDGDTWRLVGVLDIPAGTSTDWPLYFLDRVPPLGEVTYRFTSFMLDAGSATIELTAAAEAKRLYLNWGDGFAGVVSEVGGEISYALARGKELVRFAGRAKPVEMASSERERVWTFKAYAAGTTGGDVFDPVGRWDELADATAPVCLRGVLGHRIFGSISDMAYSWQTGGLVEVSGKVTEVAWEEPEYAD